MKTLHFYVTRQIVATLVMAVAVFAFVLLLGNGLKEILILLINRQATLGGVLEAFALLIPFVLAFALPMGMLTAALLVFGRLSADQELIAVRSSGVSLLALSSPILLFSLFLCGISAIVNLEIAPRSRVSYKGLLDRMSGEMAGMAFPEKRPIRDFPGCLLWVDKVDGHNLRGVYICKWDTQKNESTAWAYAPRGRFEITNQQAVVHLENPIGSERVGKTWRTGITLAFGTSFDLREPHPENRKLDLRDMTFSQLSAELQAARQLSELQNLPGLNSDDSSAELREWKQRGLDMTLPILAQMHRQVAFSFACFSFTLIGIPLGIRAHRRETNAGIALALLLTLVYYGLIILGQSLEIHSRLAAFFVIWIPNILFQTAGAIMLWRANRGI